jgi:hypothetical protein
MIARRRSATLRRRLPWVAFVVLGCSVIASLRIRHRLSDVPYEVPHCDAAERDSVDLARMATDTIGDLRSRSQRVKSYSWTSHGLEVRTEDNDSLAAHDGGLAAFDCAGRLTFLWLDGG